MHQGIPFMIVPESTTLAVITLISCLLSMSLYASSHTVFSTTPISHSAIEKETEDQTAHVRKAVRCVSCLPLKAADHLDSHASSNPFSLLFFLFLPWPAFDTLSRQQFHLCSYVALGSCSTPPDPSAPFHKPQLTRVTLRKLSERIIKLLRWAPAAQWALSQCHPLISNDAPLLKV